PHHRLGDLIMCDPLGAVVYAQPGTVIPVGFVNEGTVGVAVDRERAGVHRSYAARCWRTRAMGLARHSSFVLVANSAPSTASTDSSSPSALAVAYRCSPKAARVLATVWA